MDDIGAHHDIKLLLAKDLLEPFQISRIRNIDRRLIREQMHVKFIRNRHIYDLAPHQMRLRFLGPGEFIHSEEHGKTHLADFSGNLFV